MVVGGVAPLAVFAASRTRLANRLPPARSAGSRQTAPLLLAAHDCGLQYLGEREDALACLAHNLRVGQGALDDGVEVGRRTLDGLDGTLLSESELTDLRHGSAEA
jgi:hypothetical protein